MSKEQLDSEKVKQLAKDSAVKLDDDENIIFNDYIWKYNHVSKKQKRVIMITNKNFYNIAPNGGVKNYLKSFISSNVKGKISLKEVTGITVSRFGNEFVIHFNNANNHDYRYQSIENRDQILLLCCKAYNIVNSKKCAFYYKDDLTLTAYCTTKDDLKKKPINTRMPKEEPQLLSPEEMNDNENAIGQMTVIFNKQNSLKLGIQDFNLIKVLGRGAFGKVMLVQKKEDSQLFAIKSIRKEDIIEKDQVEHTKNERKILEQAQHPFIVNLEYGFQSKEKLFFVMKFYRAGELFTHLKKEKRFKESRAKFYFAQILLALEYIHGFGAIYRDLKPENILMDEHGYLRLTDFGLAKFLKKGEQTNSFVGTPEYLAPEIIKCNGHDFSCDWWALGILLFEMIVGIPPFYNGDHNIMFENILKRDVKFPNPNSIKISENARDLILKLLTKDPQQRLGSRNDAQDIIEHSFFDGFDWVALKNKQIQPEFIPKLPADPTDVSEMFDEQFTNEEAVNSYVDSDVKMLNQYEDQFTGMTYNKQQL